MKFLLLGKCRAFRKPISFQREVEHFSSFIFDDFEQGFPDKYAYNPCVFIKQDYPCITVAGLGEKDIKNDPNEEIDQLNENVRIAVGGMGLFKDTDLPWTNFFKLYYQ